MSLTRIGSIGINTGIAFAGVTTIVTLNTANDALSIGATVNVGSGITLGASGDIFATGVSTVTTLKVGSGVTVSSDGDVFFTGIATGNGSGLTALNASNLGSGTVPTARLGSGTASSSTFLRGDSTFQTVSTDLVDDTTPQLGGNLDVNSKNIVFGDSSGANDDRLTFGAGTDFSIYHDGNHTRLVDSGTGDLVLQGSDTYLNSADNQEHKAIFYDNGGVKLFYNHAEKFEVTSGGVEVTGGINLTTNLSLLDSGYLKLGTGDDLQLYHNGSHSVITNSTGTLFTLADNLSFKNNANNETLITAAANGAVELYHDNSKKLITDSTGIDINTGGTEVGTKIKMYGSDALTRTRWGYSSAYKGIILGRTDVNTNSTIFMGYDPTGNTSGAFTGDGREIVFRSNTSFVTPTSANDNWNTPIRFGRGTSTEGAINFPNGVLFQNDQADANILDDYEEGTWSPGGDWDTTVATYTKIGRVVHAACQVRVNTTGSGNMQITNLPYACGNNEASRNGVFWGWNEWDSTVYGQLTGNMAPNTTTLNLYRMDGSGSAVTYNQLGNDKYLKLVVCYQTE